MTSPLIDAQTLSARLEDPQWVVVDCRFRLTQPDAGLEMYKQAHIPGARYAHLDQDLAASPRPEEGRHPLPSPEAFKATTEQLGISNSSTVVAYDDASGAIAARFWWMLRWVGHDAVFVLDRGIQGWGKASLPLESTDPTWESAQFSLGQVREDWVVKTRDIPGELAQGAALVDARSPERYAGQEEPIDPIAGHIPGAVNYPFSLALDSAGAMRDSGELRRELEPLTQGPRGLIATCGSGVTACHLLLAVKAAGLGDGRAYIGSWSEWIRDPGREIETEGTTSDSGS